MNSERKAMIAAWCVALLSLVCGWLTRQAFIVAYALLMAHLAGR